MVRGSNQLVRSQPAANKAKQARKVKTHRLTTLAPGRRLARVNHRNTNALLRHASMSSLQRLSGVCTPQYACPRGTSLGPKKPYASLSRTLSGWPRGRRAGASLPPNPAAKRGRSSQHTPTCLLDDEKPKMSSSLGPAPDTSLASIFRGRSPARPTAPSLSRGLDCPPLRTVCAVECPRRCRMNDRHKTTENVASRSKCEQGLDRRGRTLGYPMAAQRKTRGQETRRPRQTSLTTHRRPGRVGASPGVLWCCCGAGLWSGPSVGVRCVVSPSYESQKHVRRYQNLTPSCRATTPESLCARESVRAHLFTRCRSPAVSRLCPIKALASLGASHLALSLSLSTIFCSKHGTAPILGVTNESGDVGLFSYILQYRVVSYDMKMRFSDHFFPRVEGCVFVCPLL